MTTQASCDHRWPVRSGHLLPLPWAVCARCRLPFGERADTAKRPA